MNTLSHYLLMPREVGRTHDAVIGMKLGVGNKVYVCANDEHAKQIAHEHDIKTISIGQLHKLQGSNVTPIFDHFALGNYIAKLEEQKEDLHRKNLELHGRLDRIKRIAND